MNKQKFKRFVWDNKEGILIGGVVGYVFSRFFFPDYIDLNTVMQTQGIVDVLSSAGKSAVELAKTKVIYAFTVIGATIGMGIDMSLKEGWYRKWL